MIPTHATHTLYGSFYLKTLLFLLALCLCQAIMAGECPHTFRVASHNVGSIASEPLNPAPRTTRQHKGGQSSLTPMQMLGISLLLLAIGIGLAFFTWIPCIFLSIIAGIFAFAAFEEGDGNRRKYTHRHKSAVAYFSIFAGILLAILDSMVAGFAMIAYIFRDFGG